MFELKLHFPCSVDCCVRHYACANRCNYGKWYRTCESLSHVFCWVGWTKKKCREDPGEEPNLPRCNREQPYGGGVLCRKLEPGMRFISLMCLSWRFSAGFCRCQWDSRSFAELTVYHRAWLTLASASPDTTPPVLLPTATKVMAQCSARCCSSLYAA